MILTQVAFLGHDAAHRQIFADGRANNWTSLVLADLFVGLSHGWWQRKHTRHHANPNKIDADPDIDLEVLAFTPEQAATRTSKLVGLVPATTRAGSSSRCCCSKASRCTSPPSSGCRRGRSSTTAPPRSS